MVGLGAVEELVNVGSIWFERGGHLGVWKWICVQSQSSVDMGFCSGVCSSPGFWCQSEDGH